MSKDDKGNPDKQSQEQYKSRQELRDRIQSLEWSVAQKNRLNKKLSEEIVDLKKKTEANSDDGDSKSG